MTVNTPVIRMLEGLKGLVIQYDECCHLSVTLSILSQLLSG